MTSSDPEPVPPFSLHGTDFQRKVWAGLCDLAYGETISYAELARRIGQAIGLNALAILVPCHRVIAKNRTLGGYAGGDWRKEDFLLLEQLALLRIRGESS